MQGNILKPAPLLYGRGAGFMCLITCIVIYIMPVFLLRSFYLLLQGLLQPWLFL